MAVIIDLSRFSSETRTLRDCDDSWPYLEKVAPLDRNISPRDKEGNENADGKDAPAPGETTGDC
jgi:hypothetical protein